MNYDNNKQKRSSKIFFFMFLKGIVGWWRVKKPMRNIFEWYSFRVEIQSVTCKWRHANMSYAATK